MTTPQDIASGRKPTVLFTGGGGSASQSIWDQWSERYDLVFADANVEAIPPAIPATAHERIPFARDASFLEAVKSICDRRRVDVIVPGVDEELGTLATRHGAPGWPTLLVPSADFVELMLDKLACAEALRAAGLTAPKTLPLDRAEEIGFPLIAKPRSGRGSRGVMTLDRPEQADAYLTLYGLGGQEAIAQQLAPGDEYTVFVAADHNAQLQAVIPVRAFEKRGVTIRARVERPQAIIDYAIAFQSHFRPSGVYNIQCMLSSDGQVMPFEVNPRISTTFCLGIATGFDPIAMALELSPQDMTPFSPSGEWTLRRSWFNHIERTR